MPGTRRLTIALAGAPGSGKSTVAGDLAERLGGEAASFGDFVRHIASQVGRDHERATLQGIGHARVEEGAEAFVMAFLAWAKPEADRPVIIDGVRHRDVDASLRSWASREGRDYALVLIEASVHERARRRHGGDENEVGAIDAHPVERETRDALPGVADLVVDGNGRPDEVVARIVEGLGPMLPGGC